MYDVPEPSPSDHSDLILKAMKKETLKFIVCVDHRTESSVALRLACLKARKRDGEVAILHVIEPAEAQSLFGVSEKMRDEKMQDARTMLDSLSQLAESITGKTPDVILEEGSIGDTIVRVAQEDSDVNMLVLGVSPGTTRGKLVAWLSTQLGEKLLMPMMLIPGNLTDQQLIEII
ncbi:MAG: universal stress protein [Sphaerospermopsis sp. SIO1G2]|nr:universal stress protein [Sphaerospermopsis sp. SIO1G2]